MKTILITLLFLALALPSYAIPPAAYVTENVGISDGTDLLSINSDGSLSVTSTGTTPAVASCKKTVANSQGASGADITIDATAGGITILAASTTRCGAIIKNKSANEIRCSATTTTVTSTVGFPIGGGETVVLGLEGQEAYKCIRTGANSGTVSTLEATP